jgi:hypothetical protein
MFHVENNLYVGRTVDGHVRLVKFNCPRAPHVMWKYTAGVVSTTESPDVDGVFQSVEVVLDVRLTPEQWASVVASVSAQGESGGRFQEALTFHKG